jgi:phosphoribosylformylglycinamidine cyclo-ligase
VYNPKKPYKNQILELIRETWKSPYISVKEGTYALFKKKFDYTEVDHTDGIGTKGIYHWQKRSFRAAVQDALAMNLNDLALVCAVPYKLQCHLILPEDDKRAILEIMKAMTDECKKRKIAITGGETSIHNNMEGMDISMTVSGFVKERRVNQFKAGDALVGIRSNGIHSNGLTKARQVLYRSDQYIKPTAIYLDNILDLNEKYKINGMMHITGGAFTKLKDLLNGNDVHISNSHKLKPQNIFREIYKKGVPDKEMYQTFNCGVGFVFSTALRNAKKIIYRSSDMDIIGIVESGSGKIKIKSMFSDKLVHL